MDKNLDCSCTKKVHITKEKEHKPGKCPHTIIKKLVELMDNPMTKDQVERQVELLNDFMEATPYAFWLRDLSYVIRVIEILRERIQVPQFHKSLDFFLAKCATPPMMEKSSDTYLYADNIKELFTLLGYLFLFSTHPINRELTHKAIHSLLLRKEPVDKCYVPMPYIFKGMENSELISILAILLPIIELDFYSKLLDLIEIICKSGPLACQMLIRDKYIDIILLRMDPDWTARKKKELPELIDPQTIRNGLPNLEKSCDILWTLLTTYQNSPSEVKEQYKGPTQKCLWSLHYAFRLLCKVKTMFKVDRNQVVAILLLMLELFPKMPFRGSGLPEDICLISVASEMGTNGTWASEMTYGDNPDDYRLKKLLLICLYYCCKHETVEVFKKRNTVAALLRITHPQLTISWNQQHFCQLSSVALCILREMIPLVPDDFIASDGPAKILKLVDIYTFNEFDEVRLNLIVSLICVITEKDDSINAAFQKAEAPLNLIMCAKKLIEYPKTRMLQRCFGAIFYAIEVFTREKEIHNVRIIKLCMDYIKHHMNPTSREVTQDPIILFCTIDLLWNMLNCSDSNQTYFMRKGGTYLMLDLMKFECWPVKVMCLGLLVDLMESGKCISHMLTWRDHGKPLIPMLMELFREYNKFMGVKHSNRGVIEDIENPLMPRLQRMYSYSISKDPNSSPGTLSMLGSIRPKIYAVLQLLERHKERVDIINEVYRICPTKYDVDTEITLVLASNYLGLKLGEMWNEVSKGLELQRIIPLRFDFKLMHPLANRLCEWSLHLRTLQLHLLQKEKLIDHEEEIRFYNKIKEGKLAVALDALHELHYIARCTESLFRLMEKRKYRKMLKAAKDIPVAMLEYHRTFMYNINVNPVYNQTVMVDSNKIEDPFAETFNLKLVSPRVDNIVITEPQCEAQLSDEEISLHDILQ